jgi:hypothetical protein
LDLSVDAGETAHVEYNQKTTVWRGYIIDFAEPIPLIIRRRPSFQAKTHGNEL